MSVCRNPSKAQRDANGNVSFSGKSSNPDLWLPCGQCIACRKTYAENWGIRMVHEAQFHPENSFITLTYSDDNLPVNGSLDYSHTKKFLMRMNSALSKTPYAKKIKYYLAGEYGDQLGRPHYHAIIFGFDFSYAIRYKGTENVRELKYKKNGNSYYGSTFLDDLWGLGHCDIGDVNYSTCRYTASYVTKKISGKLASSHYGSKLPERAFMSRREAIGRQWLDQFWSDVYPEDVCILDGKRLKVPKYYDKYLEKNNPSLYEEVKQSREQSAVSVPDLADNIRSHEFQYLNQLRYQNDLTGAAPINEIDRKIIDYNRRQADYYHFQRKKL